MPQFFVGGAPGGSSHGPTIQSASPLLISTQLPSAADIRRQLEALQARLAALPHATGRTTRSVRQNLQRDIAAKQAQLDQMLNPRDQSGVPPAPDAAPVFGPRIEIPKVNFDSLKIFLPQG